MKLTITIEADSADEAVKIARALAVVGRVQKSAPVSEPEKPRLSAIAAGYQPTPARIIQEDEPEIPDFLRRVS